MGAVETIKLELDSKELEGLIKSFGGRDLAAQGFKASPFTAGDPKTKKVLTDNQRGLEKNNQSSEAFNRSLNKSKAALDKYSDGLSTAFADVGASLKEFGKMPAGKEGQKKIVEGQKAQSDALKEGAAGVKNAFKNFQEKKDEEGKGILNQAFMLPVVGGVIASIFATGMLAKYLKERIITEGNQYGQQIAADRARFGSAGLGYGAGKFSETAFGLQTGGAVNMGTLTGLQTLKESLPDLARVAALLGEDYQQLKGKSTPELLSTLASSTSRQAKQAGGIENAPYLKEVISALGFSNLADLNSKLGGINRAASQIGVESKKGGLIQQLGFSKDENALVSQSMGSQTSREVIEELSLRRKNMAQLSVAESKSLSSLSAPLMNTNADIIARHNEALAEGKQASFLNEVVAGGVSAVIQDGITKAIQTIDTSPINGAVEVFGKAGGAVADFTKTLLEKTYDIMTFRSPY